MQLGAPEIAILKWLAGHERATALAIGSACGIAVASVRGRLRFLEKQKLVTGKPNDAVPPRRAYTLTDEGRRKSLQ